MSVKDASIKWKVSERRVQILCKEGRINGVEKFGNSWIIPINSEKPIDGRTNSVNNLDKE